MATSSAAWRRVMDVGMVVLLVATLTGPAGAAQAPAQDRWSGTWDVEGDSNEDGVYEHFGVLEFRLVTDGSLNLIEPDWPCEDADRDYRGSYQFGGEGQLVGCESSKFDNELFLEYHADDGNWGQANITYKAGSPPTWEGYYSPPTMDPAGEQAYLRWRATKVQEPVGCSAASARAAAAGSDCADPVIFVPGFLGTEISCPGHGGELWPDAPTPEFDNMLLNEAGTENFKGGSECNEHAGPADVVFRAFGTDVYGGMRTYLRSLEGVRTYFLAYDWRKAPGHAETQQALDRLVNRARSESGRRKVTLVAHSMGGLVSRWYVAHKPKKVARVVTLGTPYWGAPKPWLALSQGWTGPPSDGWLPDLDSFIPDGELRRFARNAAGAFYLYPSRAYYAEQGGWLRLGSNGSRLNAKKTLRAVRLYGGTAPLYRRALNGHENVLDGYAGRRGLDWQMIVGTGVPTVTEITEYPQADAAPTYAYGNGDGTVPLISQSQGLLGREAIVHYVCGVEHAALPGDTQVQQMITDFILTGGPITSSARTPCAP
jgi:pimeloyl-ACP methyl ester carboxylesterase